MRMVKIGTHLKPSRFAHDNVAVQTRPWALQACGSGEGGERDERRDAGVTSHGKLVATHAKWCKRLL